MYPYEPLVNEPLGGTWIGANDSGLALALLNWNILPRPSGKRQSRGRLIPMLLAATSPMQLQSMLQGLDLQSTAPFRLVGVFPGQSRVCEWRWSGEKLHTLKLLWKTQYWFSSSLGDDQAAVKRMGIVNRFAAQPGVGGVAWLRRLHKAHNFGTRAGNVETGSFGICVHRKTVGSVSYTEIQCKRETIRCYYKAGSPCSPLGTQKAHTVILQRQYVRPSR